MADLWRRKVLRLNERQLSDLLRLLPGVPDDATVLSGNWRFENGELSLVLHSEQFPETASGADYEWLEMFMSR